MNRENEVPAYGFDRRCYTNMPEIRNPYESPQHQEVSTAASSKLVRWRIVPTMFLTAFGSIAFLIAAVFVAGVIKTWFEIGSDAEIREAFFSGSRLLFFAVTPLCFMLCGVLWLVSARACWRCRWKRAWVTGLFGLLAVIVAANMMPLR